MVTILTHKNRTFQIRHDDSSFFERFSFLLAQYKFLNFCYQSNFDLLPDRVTVSYGPYGVEWEHLQVSTSSCHKLATAPKNDSQNVIHIYKKWPRFDKKKIYFGNICYFKQVNAKAKFVCKWCMLHCSCSYILATITGKVWPIPLCILF